MNFTTCAFTYYCTRQSTKKQGQQGNHYEIRSGTWVPMSPKYVVVVTQVPWYDNSNSWWLHWYPNVATIIHGSCTGTRTLVSLQYFVALVVH